MAPEVVVDVEGLGQEDGDPVKGRQVSARGRARRYLAAMLGVRVEAIAIREWRLQKAGKLLGRGAG